MKSTPRPLVPVTDSRFEKIVTVRYRVYCTLACGHTTIDVVVSVDGQRPEAPKRKRCWQCQQEALEAAPLYIAVCETCGDHSVTGMPIIGKELKISDRKRPRVEALADGAAHLGEFPTHKARITMYA